MAEIQQGLAVVWGALTGATFSINGTGIGYMMSDAELAKSGDNDLTRNEAGVVVNVTTYDNNEQLQLTVFPKGTTRTAANSANSIPKKGDYMAIIDGSVTDAEISAASTGRVYYVDEATKNRSNTSKVSMKVTLRRWDGITNYVPV